MVKNKARFRGNTRMLFSNKRCDDKVDLNKQEKYNVFAEKSVFFCGTRPTVVVHLSPRCLNLVVR